MNLKSGKRKVMQNNWGGINETKLQNNRLTDCSNAVVLLRFSSARFDVRVSATFYLACVQMIFSLVHAAEWPPLFWKKLLTR